MIYSYVPGHFSKQLIHVVSLNLQNKTSYIGSVVPTSQLASEIQKLCSNNPNTIIWEKFQVQVFLTSWSMPPLWHWNEWRDNHFFIVVSNDSSEHWCSTTPSPIADWFGSHMDRGASRTTVPWGHKELDMTEWLRLSFRGFPAGTSGKETAWQCRRHKRCRFKPWAGKTPWRRAWQSTPVFWPGEFQGQGSLVGYSP